MKPCRRLGMLMALGVGSILVCTTPSAAAAQGKGFLDRMHEWQDKMTERFRDTWKDLRGEGKSGASASLDLREQKDSYTVRLSLPDRNVEKVEIRLEGDRLHIAAPAEGKLGRYDQTVELAGVDAATQPKIERRKSDDLITVTVPKSSSIAESKPPLTLPDPSVLPFSDWDRDIVSRMDQMRRDMDRIFQDSFADLRLTPEHKGFFDEPRFGSSVDLKEEGDHYVVRAYLPDRDMQNVNVKVEGDILRIEAKEQEASKKEGAGGELHRSRHAAYSQVLTLPGPVKSQEMKVDKKDGMLVITLPKAK